MRILIILLALLWLPSFSHAQNSDEDQGYLTRLLQESLSGSGHDVRIRGFAGALSSRASIETLTISDDDGEWFRAETIVLDWNRSALLRGRVEVETFSADRIVFTRKPNATPDAPKAEATPFTIPDLPVSVDISEISVGSAFIGAAVVGEDAEFTLKGSASLANGGAEIAFNLDRIDGEVAQIELAAGYDPSSRQLTVDLNASEEPGGIVGRLAKIPGQPSLALTAQGEGLVDDFAANIDLETEGQPRITGTIEIRAPQEVGEWNVQVDITGDPTPLLTEDIQPFFGPQVGLQAEVIRRASGRIELTQFEMAAAKVSMTGTATVTETGWLDALDAKGRISNPDGGPVVLPTGNGGTRVQSITFDATLADDIVFDAVVQDFQNPSMTLGSLRLAGRGALNPQTFAETGQLELDMTWAAEAIDLADPGLAEAVGTRLDGAARVDYTSGQPLRVTGIKANGADYGLSGDATWSSEDALPVTLDLRIVAQDIRRFSTLAGRDLAGRIEVQVDGGVEPLSGAFDLVLDGTTLDLSVGQNTADRVLAGIGSARVDVRRDETGTTIRSARVVTSAVRLEATGQIASASSALRFDGRLADLDRVFPGEGKGSALLNGAVTFDGTQLRTAGITAELSNQTGEVRLPFAGGVTLSSGTVSVDATGGPQGKWTVEVASQDLQSRILSAGVFELAGNGDLQQAESGALVSASGSFRTITTGLRVADAGIAQALGTSPVLTATFDWQQDNERLAVSAFNVDTGSIDLSGSALVTSALSAPDVQVSVAFVADRLTPLSGLAGQPLRGRASIDVSGSYTSTKAFRVRATGQGTGLGINNATLDQLLVGTTRFEFSASGQKGVLDTLSADLANSEIQASVSGPLSNLVIDARLRDLGLIAPDFPGPLTVSGTVGQQARQYVVNVDVTGPGGATLRVDGSVSESSRANLNIQGTAALGLVNAFIEPRRLNGRAELDLSVNGPLALTSLSGTITPSQAELSAPTLGIILKPVTGQIVLQNGAAQINLAAQGNNGGSIDVSGRLGLSSLDAGLTTTLNRFGVRDVELYDTSVDGTINITGPIGRDLLIAGALQLNETEVQVPSSGVSALSEIPNIEHLGTTRPVMRTLERAGLTKSDAEVSDGSSRSSTRLDLTLSAPRQIFVRGRGLDAELGGSLRLTGPTSDIIPQGGFELVRGRLDILNQRFVLTEGRIQMSGSFDPVLRFVATTESNGITVLVILEGPVSAPDISFSSSPELPEDEVLAQLLFGRNLNDLSPLQALQLANAVATLAGGNAGGLLSDLRNSFGLDDLDLARTDDGGTAVRAGKYISENVYSDVVVESGGRTEVSINLDITKSLTARGSVDTQGNSSIGIFFERDY